MLINIGSSAWRILSKCCRWCLIAVAGSGVSNEIVGQSCYLVMPVVLAYLNLYILLSCSMLWLRLGRTYQVLRVVAYHGLALATWDFGKRTLIIFIIDLAL